MSESGSPDAFLLNRCYGGDNDDCSISVVETSDGCLAAGGYTESTVGYDVLNKRGAGDDIWLFKINRLGNYRD